MPSLKIVRLLIIGQTPPPFVGQMLSIESLTRAHFDDIFVFHTRMNYSKTTGEIGKVRLGKLLHLLRVILESSYKILRHRIDVIYYPPGADTVPILRDMITLLALRRFNRKLILVFHASGLCETVAKWKGFRLWLFKKAFLFPDAAIQKSSLNPPDGEFVKARAIYTVPNGWADHFEAYRQSKAANFAPVILSVGLVREDKGAGILVEAARLLKARGRKFQVRFVGEFTSEEYRQQLLSRVKALGLEAEIEFCGRQVDDEKWMLYRNADIFCFPTFYPAESFGNVLVEAMMFELPVVATRWRAIPEIVEDGATGFLTEIKDANAVADRLEKLIQDKVLRITMGRKGREQYLAKFTLKKYLYRTRDVVVEVAHKHDGNCTIKTRETRRLSTEAG